MFSFQVNESFLRILLCCQAFHLLKFLYSDKWPWKCFGQGPFLSVSCLIWPKRMAILVSWEKVMINHRKSCHSALKGSISCSEASAPLASTHQTTKMAPTFSVCVLSASTNASLSRHLHLIFYGTAQLCILSMDILDWGMRTEMYLVTKVVKWLKSGKFVEVISVVCVYVFDTGRLWEESWSDFRNIWSY